MQICFYFPALANDQNNLIFGSMYDSFFKKIKAQGVNVKLTTNLNEIEGDILVTNIGSGYEKTAAKAMIKFKGPVILSIYNAYITFNKSFLKRWKKRILFAYNSDFANLNYIKYNSVGIPYFHLPFGSDSDVFKPLNLQKQFDISFIGNGHSGFGREKYIQRLVEFSKENKLNIFLAGSGWEKYGYPLQLIKHGIETNEIYNLSKVCVNIHNDRQFAGIDKEMDANNRLFDLAMAGCCQVSNGEKMVVHYFSKDEVATSDDPNEWIRQIKYYLDNDIERINMGDNARKRALKDHTWNIRAIEFINFINIRYDNYHLRNQSVNIIITIARYLDQYVTPKYLFKEIRIIRFLLTKFGLYIKK